ncbi:MAG: HAD-IB family hydrolase, partial [Oceanospirillaceae bacterium]
YNDLPLLEYVTHPVTVDADEKLTQVAIERNWPQMSFR